jgi:DNA-binding NtrC family response regulator
VRAKASNPRCILIVDDDPALLNQLADLFRIEGYDVTIAEGGMAALYALEAGLEPDVVLLEVLLEGINGWDVNAEMEQRGLSIPIVVMTADPDPQKCAEQVGAIACLAKPFDYRELLRVVGRAVAVHTIARKSA